MRTLHVGRNPGCDIVYDDLMVSRSHAFIRVYPTGKYEIINKGTNGTKVNGQLISSNVPYPTKRGDDILFANTSRLDWNRVPDPLKPYKLGLMIFGIVAVITAATVGVVKLIQNYTGSSDPIEQQVEQQPKESSTDTIKSVDAQDLNPVQPLTPIEIKPKKEIKKQDKESNKKTEQDHKTKETQSKAEEKKVESPRFRSRR